METTNFYHESKNKSTQYEIACCNQKAAGDMILLGRPSCQKFFDSKVSKWIYKVKSIVIILATLIYAANIFAASNIETSNKVESVLKSSNPFAGR